MCPSSGSPIPCAIALRQALSVLWVPAEDAGVLDGASQSDRDDAGSGGEAAEGEKITSVHRG